MREVRNYIRRGGENEVMEKSGTLTWERESIILSERSQASSTCPSDKMSVKMKTLKWLDVLLFLVSYRGLNRENSLLLPVCTVAMALKAMCKCLSRVSLSLIT
jgi:hypothetical protein